MGSDLAGGVVDALDGLISIHAPAWGATRSDCTIVQRAAEFQSTLPHGERPAARGAGGAAGEISIHAPAWGATVIGDIHLRGTEISIHAPAWGATVRQMHPPKHPRNFNPRSRMGSDRSHRAPPADKIGFQSTLPHGERRRVDTAQLRKARFQSTLPHGERPRARCRCMGERLNFNPRSRMGSDWRTKPIKEVYLVYFNPRSRMGSDVPVVVGCCSRTYFNPRSRMGSDRSQPQ